MSQSYEAVLESLSASQKTKYERYFGILGGKAPVDADITPQDALVSFDQVRTMVLVNNSEQVRAHRFCHSPFLMVLLLLVT